MIFKTARHVIGEGAVLDKYTQSLFHSPMLRIEFIIFFLFVFSLT